MYIYNQAIFTGFLWNDEENDYFSINNKSEVKITLSNFDFSMFRYLYPLPKRGGNGGYHPLHYFKIVAQPTYTPVGSGFCIKKECMISIYNYIKSFGAKKRVYVECEK